MSQDLPNIRAVGVTFVAFTALMLAGLAYPQGDFVLVVGRPGMDEAGMMEIVAAAGGTYVAHGNLGWLAVAHAEGAGFTARLMQAGALLVLDYSLAAGCLERK